MESHQSRRLGAPNPGGIDRTSAEPYYAQLGRLIEADIDAGLYKPGERLPGETEMCREFALARSTVRETLRHLQRRGRVKMVPRRGAFVLSGKPTGWQTDPTKSVLEIENGLAPAEITTQVLTAEFGPLPPDIALQLRLEPDAIGFFMRRVRFYSGQPALITDSYLSEELGFILAGTPVILGKARLKAALAEAKQTIIGTQRRIEALLAPPAIAGLLNIDRSTPLLHISALCWKEDEIPVHLYRTWLRTDVVNVTFEARTLAETH